jgi:hypothetical protein
VYGLLDVELPHGKEVFYMAMDNERIVKLIEDMKESLEREIQTGLEKLEQHMNRRFDQVNARLVRVDSVWKVARDWGRGVDEHDMQSDQVIAQLVRQVASLEERLSKIEKQKQ